MRDKGWEKSVALTPMAIILRYVAMIFSKVNGCERTCCNFGAGIFTLDTAKLPMEEIGTLFGDEVVVYLTSDGQGIVEDKMAVAPGADHIENTTKM